MGGLDDFDALAFFRIAVAGDDEPRQLAWPGFFESARHLRGGLARTDDYGASLGRLGQMPLHRQGRLGLRNGRVKEVFEQGAVHGGAISGWKRKAELLWPAEAVLSRPDWRRENRARRNGLSNTCHIAPLAPRTGVLMPQRFAIYYAPDVNDALWDRATIWLGRDAADSALVEGAVGGDRPDATAQSYPIGPGVMVFTRQSSRR
jgi:hypothetical protein